VTGVQTCALPISVGRLEETAGRGSRSDAPGWTVRSPRSDCLDLQRKGDGLVTTLATPRWNAVHPPSFRRTVLQDTRAACGRSAGGWREEDDPDHRSPPPFHC